MKYYHIILYGKNGLIEERDALDEEEIKVMNRFAECDNCFKTYAEADKKLSKLLEVK